MCSGDVWWQLAVVTCTQWNSRTAHTHIWITTPIENRVNKNNGWKQYTFHLFSHLLSLAVNATQHTYYLFHKIFTCWILFNPGSDYQQWKNVPRLSSLCGLGQAYIHWARWKMSNWIDNLTKDCLQNRDALF